MSNPVFALTEGGAIWRSSTKRTLSHCVSVAVSTLQQKINLICCAIKAFQVSYLFIRYLDARRKLSADVIWILHLTSSDESSVTFSLQPFHMLRVNLFTVIHTSLQIAIELIHLLLNVAHSFKWHVEFR